MDKYEITLKTFDKLAKLYQEKYMDFEFYHDTYDLLLELLTHHKTVFEIACGPGNIAKYMRSKRPDLAFHGIDLAPAMVALAKENHPTAEFEVMDCREISSIQRKYDLIICGFCLPYISKEEALTLIKNSAKLLNRQGILYLSTMEGDESKSGFKTSSTGDQAYIHYYQAKDLIQALEQNGFQVLKIHRKNFPEPDGSFTTDLFLYAQTI